MLKNKREKYERKKSPEYMMILYFIDETEKVKLKQDKLGIEL